MDVFLETGRLVLRRFTDADLDLLVELDGDPEVMRYITGGRPTSRAGAPVTYRLGDPWPAERRHRVIHHQAPAPAGR